MQALTEKPKAEELNLNNKIRFDGETLSLDVTSYIGRMCARLCAYMLLAAGDKEAAEKIFKKVGI